MMAGVCFLVSGIDSRAVGFSDKPPPMTVSLPEESDESEESKGQSGSPRSKDQPFSLPVQSSKAHKAKEKKTKEDEVRNIEQQKGNGQGHQLEKLLTPEQQQQLDDFKRKINGIPVEQCRQEAANLALFKEMPPEQRKTLEDRFKYFQEMPAKKKEQVLKNYEQWQKMSPEEREACREKYREQIPGM